MASGRGPLAQGTASTTLVFDRRADTPEDIADRLNANNLLAAARADPEYGHSAVAPGTPTMVEVFGAAIVHQTGLRRSPEQIVETFTPEMLEHIWSRCYSPHQRFIIQLTVDNRQVHTRICPVDILHWWESMFGTTQKPIRGVWYEVPTPHGRGLAKVLFNAHDYAEAEVEHTGTDPRKEVSVPEEMSNIDELLERKGDRCEICVEEWGEDCVPESPLMHEWATCCTHFACKPCWLRLERKRCPWCKWSIDMFLQEIAADDVIPAERIPKTREPPRNINMQNFKRVGWLYADMAKLLEHFKPLKGVATDTACPGQVFASRFGKQPFFLSNETIKVANNVRIWAVVCSPQHADPVLRALSRLCSARATKMHSFRW